MEVTGTIESNGSITGEKTECSDAIVSGSTVTFKDSFIASSINANSSVSLFNTPVDGNITTKASVRLEKSPVKGDLSANYSVELVDCLMVGEVKSNSNVTIQGAETTVLKGVTASGSLNLKNVLASEGLESKSSITLAQVSSDSVVSTGASIEVEGGIIQNQVKANYSVTARNTEIQGDIRSGSSVTVNHSTVGGGIYTKGSVDLEVTQVEKDITTVAYLSGKSSTLSGEVKATSLSFDKCQASKDIVLTGNASIKNYSSLGGTLTAAPGFTIDLAGELSGDTTSSLNAKNRAFKIKAVPLLIEDSEVQSIVIKSVTPPKKEEYGALYSMKPFFDEPKEKPPGILERLFGGKKTSSKAEANQKDQQPNPVDETHPQVVELKGNTVIKGTIVFERTPGKVILHPGAILEGGDESVVGGTIERVSA
ncbi:MAG: hypothetical protein K2X66_08960 [Cyanobacteria bacterium]|nr:hypothetical protein [Cyanobacteriota bacterium]